ncbi:hypothetical protein HAX54_012004, partial [Datura stramonium]|nr:hypothetical protein [Datura stramonium]
MAAWGSSFDESNNDTIDEIALIAFEDLDLDSNEEKKGDKQKFLSLTEGEGKKVAFSGGKKGQIRENEVEDDSQRISESISMEQVNAMGTDKGSNAKFGDTK